MISNAAEDAAQGEALRISRLKTVAEMLAMPEVEFDALILEVVKEQYEFESRSIIQRELQVRTGSVREQIDDELPKAIDRALVRLAAAAKVVKYGKGQNFPSTRYQRWTKLHGNNPVYGSIELRDKALDMINAAERQDRTDAERLSQLLERAKKTNIHVKSASVQAVTLTMDTFGKLLDAFENLPEVKNAAEWFASNKPGTPVPDWIDEALSPTPRTK